MALHKTKTMHSITPTAQHLAHLYEAFTRMCEEQAHTDLTLVTSDGKAFGVHKVSCVNSVFR